MRIPTADETRDPNVWTAPRRGMSRAARVAATALLGGWGCLAALGCSGGEDRVATFPVRGRVVVNGEAASGAFVVFHPVTPIAAPEGAAGASAEVNRPTAQVKPDGSFAVSTFDEADGAPAGAYSVTVEWRKLVGEGKDVTAGPDVVPDKFRKAETSPLKVTVVEGENQLEDFKIDRRRR